MKKQRRSLDVYLSVTNWMLESSFYQQLPMIPLIPRSDVSQFEKDIEPLIESLDVRAAALASEEDSGAAFRYFLLFSQDSIPRAGILPRLTPVELFYNRYYWFFLFSQLRQIKRGIDPGLDQQALMLLEGAPGDVDWNVVQEIHDLVEKEAAAYRDQVNNSNISTQRRDLG